MKSEKPLFPQLFKGIALFTPGGDLIYSIDPSKQSHWHLLLCACLQEILGLPEPPHFLVPGYTAAIDRWLDPRTQQVRTSAEIYRPVLHHQSLLNAVFRTGNLVWQVAPWQEGSCDPIVLETYRHQFPQLWEDHDLIVRFDRARSFSYFSGERYAMPPSFGERELEQAMETPSLGEGVLLPIPQEQTTQDTADYTGHGGHQTANANTESSTREDIVQESLDVSEVTPQELPPEPRSTDVRGLTNASRSLTASHPDTEETLPDSYSQPPRAQGYVLRLFVSGHTAATEQTLKSLHQLLEHSLRHPYTLKVIDVFNHPDQAEANQISATPTLLRVWPQPVRRIVGDLEDIERVLRILAVPEP